MLASDYRVAPIWRRRYFIFRQAKRHHAGGEGRAPGLWACRAHASPGCFRSPDGSQRNVDAPLGPSPPVWDRAEAPPPATHATPLQ
jgi:hypothetical protein